MKKKHYLIGLFIIFSIFLISCGEDGEDGKAYLTIDYYGEMPIRYWDNNPAIPYGFIYGQQYETKGGVAYDYEYEYSDGIQWTGSNYTYSPLSGTSGGLFADGEDGDDSYCNFYCSRSGSYSEDGWYKSTNEGEIIVKELGYTYEIKIIEGGDTDTLQIIQKRYGELISVDKRWRTITISEMDNKLVEK